MALLQWPSAMQSTRANSGQPLFPLLSRHGFAAESAWQQKVTELVQLLAPRGKVAVPVTALRLPLAPVLHIFPAVDALLQRLADWQATQPLQYACTQAFTGVRSVLGWMWEALPDPADGPDYQLIGSNTDDRNWDSLKQCASDLITMPQGFFAALRRSYEIQRGIIHNDELNTHLCVAGEASAEREDDDARPLGEIKKRI